MVCRCLRCACVSWVRPNRAWCATMRLARVLGEPRLQVHEGSTQAAFQKGVVVEVRPQGVDPDDAPVQLIDAARPQSPPGRSVFKAEFKAQLIRVRSRRES